MPAPVFSPNMPRCTTILPVWKIWCFTVRYLVFLSRKVKEGGWNFWKNWSLPTAQILFLDEPTSGLDPKSAQSVHTLIQKLAAEKGTTVFLCTHQLRYAQEICTRYGLMDQGRLLAEGTLSDLRKQIPSPVRIKLQATGWQPFPSCKKLGENLWEMTGRSEEEIPAIVKNIVEQGGKLYHISSELPSLEDIYFHLTAAKKENTNYEI